MTQKKKDAPLRWELSRRSIEELRPFSKNPRNLSKHDHKHLKKSLEKFGLIDKPIINPDGSIIGGHQRISVLKEEGIKEVECWVPSRPLTDKETEELNIRLNRNTGEWDFECLANQWDTDELLEWGFEPGEFSIEEVETIEEEREEGDRLSRPPNDPKTKAGDLIELGNHRLLCGDSTNPDEVEKLMDGAVPILMVTDPPYGVEYDASWRSVAGKGQRAAGKVQNDDKIDWALAWSLFPGNVAYVWHAGKYCSEVQKSLEDADFEIVSQIIWAKQHFALSRGNYHWQHEPCWYAVRKGQSHNWQGSRKESTVWEIGNLNAFGKNREEDARTAHSTQKPLECMARPIRNNTAEGEGVYDPFIGSGTTLIAAHKMKRVCYGMEIDPAYCDITIDRYLRLTGDTTVKVNGEILEWEPAACSTK